MNRWKAPSSDGFKHVSPKCLDNIKNDFIKAAMYFLRSNKEIWDSHNNDTKIVIIPTKKGTLFYAGGAIDKPRKCAGKDGLESYGRSCPRYSPDIISLEQSGFIKGRSITDNFIAADELAH